MKVTLISLSVLFSFSLGVPVVISKGESQPINHQLWNQVLNKFVSNEGNVNYKGLKNNRVTFDKYLQLLKSHHPNETWTKNEQLVYWINAYNAFTVDLILEHYPVKSIKDIGGLIKIPGFQSAWDIDFIKIEDKKYSLGDIEHQILRKEFNEPRIHFAINCASYSCPQLINKAFSVNEIENQLQRVTIDFIHDSKRNKISKNELELSKIFDWYKKDFTQNGSLIDYINQYSKVNIKADAKINYMNYDWSLNE